MIKYKKIIDNIEYDVVDFENNDYPLLKDIDKYKYLLILNCDNIEYQYWKYGKYHRGNNLPQYKDKDGYLEYYHEGKEHRIDGPAIICPNGRKLYYIHGEEIFVNSDEEFLRHVELLNFG